MSREPTLDPAAARDLEALDAALAGRAVDPDLADLALLATDLRDGAPRPEPDYARRLDERAAAGFATASAGAPRREARTALSARRWFVPAVLSTGAAALLAVVVSIALLSGSSGTSGDASMAVQASTESSGASTAASAPGAAADSGTSGGSSSSAAAPPAASTTAPDAGARRVERAAQLAVSVAADRFEAAAGRVPQIAAGAGAIVESSSISSTQGRGHAEFALRVPVRRLQDTMAELSRLGRVDARDETGLDVTGRFVSAADRLGDLTAERASVRRRLAATTETAAANDLRDRLDVLQRDISAARAQLDTLRERTSYARVALTLSSRAAGDGAVAPTGGGWGVRDALDDAGAILATAASVVIVVLAVAGPLLVLLATALLGSRTLRRRRRESALG